MPLEELEMSQPLTPSGVVALAAVTVKASGSPELDKTVRDNTGAAAPLRKAIGFRVLIPPFTSSVGVALCIWSVTVTTALVLPSDAIVTVVVLRPAPSVVHPGLPETGRTLSLGVTSAVPAIGVTSSHGTVGAVTVK